jgi:tetratricopeptide (TPR) repeat protein
VRLHNIESLFANQEGSLGVRVLCLQAALGAAEAAGDVRTACEMMVNLGSAYADVGQFELADELLQKALGTAERIDLEFATAGILLNLGPVLAARGRFDEALAAMHKALLFARKQGDQRFEGGAELYVSTIAYMKGDLDEALRAATEARRICVSVPPLLPSACAALARVLLAKDRSEEGLALAREADDLVRSMGHVEDYESLIRLVLAESLAACQKMDDARAALEVACQRLVARASAIPVDAWRTSFLRLPDNLRTLGLARALGLTETAALAVAV